MKYPYRAAAIPQEKRREINEKILRIIDAGLDVGISKADVFQAYTGDGGLHGLRLSDYESFHSYTEAKKEIEQGQFFTPPALCEFLVQCIRPSENDLVADLTCGMGNFFNYLPSEQNAYGNELEIKAYRVAKYLYPEVNLVSGDIRYYEPGLKFDIIFGNPPFNLKWEVRKDTYLSQLYYCIKAAELLHPAGILALIVPDSFLQDEFMDGGMIKEMNERFSFVGQFDLPAEAFRAFGVDSFDTKIMIFQRKSENVEAKPYSAAKVDPALFGSDFGPVGAAAVYEQLVRPVLEDKERIKHKLFFERLHDSREEASFAYEVKKWLYNIKRNPAIRNHHAKCVEMVNQYYTQKKPDDMKHEEWEKKKLTKGRLLGHLKRIVRNQHHREVDKTELVKTSYGIRWKAYSAKTKRLLAKEQGEKEMSLNDMVLYDRYPFSDRKFEKLWQRKRRAFETQSQSLKEMQPDPLLQGYLDTLVITDSSTGEEIRLNTKQKQDLNVMMQKRYGILNWQQGSGKTIAALAWYRRLLDEQKVRNIFVISAALAIHMTWEKKLVDYGDSFIVIRSLKDINSIRPGQVVLLALSRLSKYKKQIQKFIKQQSQKVALVFDESDEITNHLAGQTRAVLACFRRVRYKLLATGTTTRNNLNELYSQLELLYNNSVNMICECDTIYGVDKENDIVPESNPRYMEPFPAYGGPQLFKNCFNPAKTTVFGIKKHNQDVYNQQSLTALIEKTVITRKFQEIVGRKIYSIETHRIAQNEAEKAIYVKIMREFHDMMHYFRKTGNDRKESMLKLVRQIQLLIKSTSSPHKFVEYDSLEIPNKFSYIAGMVGKIPGKVAIGTVFVETAEEYCSMLKGRFPDRPVFLVKGDVVFKRRNQIISRFEETDNGILVSTQQSLKSSVNIPSCNDVIIESLQWNLPKIEQYMFRFIRYNSKEHKRVHFVTYDFTIEQNLLALLMAKERLNEYIKTLEFKEQADIFDEYGLDLDILNAVIEKEVDKEGNVRLAWGKQEIA